MSFWKKITPGNLLTIALIVGGFFVTWKQESSRLDLIEYRLGTLEATESRDFAELKGQVRDLAESLKTCQAALIRLEADVAHIRER